MTKEKSGMDRSRFPVHMDIHGYIHGYCYVII